MNCKSKVCAGIILFHPDINRLKLSIEAVLHQVERLILINNAPEDTDRLQDVFSDCNLVWIINNENLGIATALNQLLTYAVGNEYEWVLTLDQDSVCWEGLVDKLYHACQNYEEVAMVSPRIIERGAVWEDRKRTDTGKPTADAEEVPFCITSGTLTNAKAVLDAGGFDERLFIDEVDRDMCIRLKKRGYKLLRVNSAALHHEFGIELVQRRILFKTYEYRNYSPYRVYYQIRNMVYMVRKYGADYKPYPIWRLIRPFLTFTVKFIFEPQRLKRLKAFFKGYKDGLFMEIKD